MKCDACGTEVTVRNVTLGALHDVPIRFELSGEPHSPAQCIAVLVAGSNARMALWAHCVSEHAAILSPEISFRDLEKYHDHEHGGPGTIRNHERSSRDYSIKKIGQVLSEADG
jgi:hypothetical protein